MATRGSYYGPSRVPQSQQYTVPPTSPFPNAQLPPPPPGPPPGPPPSPYLPYVLTSLASPAINPPEAPPQRQSYVYAADGSSLQTNTYPPPPQAPPTPAYTPTTSNGSNYFVPSQSVSQTLHQQWSNNGQFGNYQLATTAQTSTYLPYSPPLIKESTPQLLSQATINLPPTPQYTPAAYGYGGSVPGAPGRTHTSYFPQQPQTPQILSATVQPVKATIIDDQNLTVASPPAVELEQPDLSKLSLNEPEQPPRGTSQYILPDDASIPTPTTSTNDYNDTVQEEAKSRQEYAQPSPLPSPSTTSQSLQNATEQATVYFPPPPPYFPNPQVDQNLQPQETLLLQPQASHTEGKFQLQQQQAWREQAEAQAQVSVQQQSPYHGGVQQQQYTQIQIQNPVMGLQHPQHAHAQIQQFQQAQPAQQLQSGLQAQAVHGQQAPAGILAHQPGKDDEKTGKVTRFLGDTLVGRFARSSVSTVTTTLKMPAVLSPWGDNNPVTLPNVRYRDAALFGTFAVIGAPLMDGVSDAVTNSFGADHFISEVVSSGAGFVTGNTIIKYGVFQIVEQAIDKGHLEHVLPEVERTMRSTTAKTLQVSIKHKLMGVEADIRMHSPYPAASPIACDKGWFAPYLFASSRTPIIKRSEDFAMAQFFKPYLIADSHLTHKLLTESASVIPLCDPSPSIRLPYARVLVTFVGISPYRGESSGMWSTSRRPGCGQLRIHMINGCPTLVIPAHSDAQRTPVIAWSPWTLKQMHEGSGRVGLGAQGEYTPQKQHQEVCSWLLGLVERGGVYSSITTRVGSLERVLGKVITMIINGAMSTPRGGKIFGVLDIERAGIVAMRY